MSSLIFSLLHLILFVLLWSYWTEFRISPPLAPILFIFDFLYNAKFQPSLKLILHSFKVCCPLAPYFCVRTLPTDLHQQFKPDDIMIASSVLLDSNLIYHACIISKDKVQNNFRAELVSGCVCVNSPPLLKDKATFLHSGTLLSVRVCWAEIPQQYTDPLSPSLIRKHVSLSHFLSPCSWIVRWKTYGSGFFSDYIKFPSKCSLLPRLFLALYFSHQVSTKVNGRPTSFTKQPKWRGLLRPSLSLEPPLNFYNPKYVIPRPHTALKKSLRNVIPLSKA